LSLSRSRLLMRLQGPVLTGSACWAVGAVALRLAGKSVPTYLPFPVAGIALAGVLVWGRSSLLGVWLGVFFLRLGIAGAAGWQAWVLPAMLASALTLQAATGGLLVNRFAGRPLLLNEPSEWLRFASFGAFLPCLIEPSLSFGLQWAGAGAMPARELTLTNLALQWACTSLGALVGAPLLLSFVAEPRSNWRGRVLTLSLPLILALALLGAVVGELDRFDFRNQQVEFERDVGHLADEAQARLAGPLDALQALHSVARARQDIDANMLRQASRWWLAQGLDLLAMGYSERVPLAQLPGFEAQARKEFGSYRVFDRDGGAARAADGEVLAMRYVEPRAGNQGALGVNSLSVPAAREALLAARDSGEPTATSVFELTQSQHGETGVVLYQALYRGDPRTLAERRAWFRGAVFVTLRANNIMAGLAPSTPAYLRWCLVDLRPGVAHSRVAGPPGCPEQPAAPMHAERLMTLAGRPLELRVSLSTAALPVLQQEAFWLRRMVGLGAAAMLSLLMLMVTGVGQRTRQAVEQGTAELRRQIRERAEVEAALRDSESRLRSILDHVPIGVLFLDPQGRLIECNPRLVEMLGRPAVSLRGMRVSDFVDQHELARLMELRRAMLAGANVLSLERMHLTGEQGRALTVRVTASALRDDDGRVVRMVGALQDITEHLRLEASERALQQAEAGSRAKSEFVSRMSHELRTPLNAMIGFAQLLGLDRGPALAEHQREWVQQIQRAGWHLLEMINETLDLARIESGAVQLAVVPVALQPLVAACLAMLAGSAQARNVLTRESLGADAGAVAVAVMADATRLKQVLINLLSNAIKYNRPGGTVSLSARRVEAEPGAGAGGARVEITVADTGLGMSREQLAGLFQPYNRLGREGSGIEGTGIGLAISHRLSELMGGTLQASSVAGQGSTFTLTLPAAEAAQAPPPRFSDTSPAPYQQRFVHYIEDNETNIEVMRGIFAQRAQIQLDTSMLGLDGLSAIRANRPDLVLLDMQLPDISGIELLRHLKQDDSVGGIPVVVVSADATPGNIQEALVAGAQHYATKPLDVAEFLRVVDAILEEADTRWGM
jgi:PAS domain S-box-containing protein